MRSRKLFMDTVVDIQVVTGTGENVETGNEERNPQASEQQQLHQINRAFHAFRQVEQACSRFSPESELMKASRQIGEPVQISSFLFEPLKLALHMAQLTSGVFDPTVGKRLEQHGFNRHYLTRQYMNSSVVESADYRDIILDEVHQTMTLLKPLVIDLGAVAKGFAIDLAAHELQRFAGFVVNAGGDLYAGGRDEHGEPWKIGIQHPVNRNEVICTLELSNAAICTSGGYERRSATTEGVHHLIHPVTGHSPKEWVSSSIIAPYAMMADIFSTAVMLLSKEEGQQLIQQANVQSILITPDIELVREGVH
ncbi:FAD:protein FMN transferase [Paenibacillus barcinonensis]|uniref:FAD:protein FMN transferase n=1 Tax=Paenibacillus barcinonensis TaxID=198119 RepID=A0ABX6QE20_PAEBA|nr:FAD:protein FMN transferase [Paenibacillus barcinonensis]